MKNYERLWNEHKKFLQRGIVYYDSLLDHFEDKESEQYEKVDNVKATYQFHLDRVEGAEKSEGVNK